MKKVYFLIICLILNVSGCDWTSSPDQESWIHGKWLSIGRSEYSVNKDKSSPPGHVIVFTRNGKIKRYSKDKGWVLIKGFFKTEDTVLKLRAKEEFRDFGQLRKDGKLLMDFTRGRYVLYERLSENEKVEELNLSEKLPIIDINDIN